MTTYTITVGGSEYTITVKEDWQASNFINDDDFNRIEQNIVTTRSALVAILYTVPAIVSVLSRDQTYIDYLASVNRIEGNLETIRTHFTTPPAYGPAKTWLIRRGFDWTDANRWERNIRLLFVYIEKVYESFRYCGTFNAGEEGLL